MYQHLLVPIDGTPLARATVEQAVAYARTNGARVTFFHARPDYSAGGDGALLQVMAPEVFAESAAGNARALLAKAEAAARAAGVTADSVVVTSDRAHEAILEAATSQGCDLIFMASRGRRGLKAILQGSVTQKVLHDTKLPVLVAAVERNLPASDEQRALAIIRNEHRSLAAVVHGLEHVLRQAQKSGTAPDFTLLRAMVHYIETFPEGLHHPKEEAYLFRKLRARTHECDAVITELERQHAEGAVGFDQMRSALTVYESGVAGGAEAFAAAVSRYVETLWQHMDAEESSVMPAASRFLTADDWSEIANAFAENRDPRFDADTDASFEQLFERLMNLLEQDASAHSKAEIG